MSEMDAALLARLRELHANATDFSKGREAKPHGPILLAAVKQHLPALLAAVERAARLGEAIAECHAQHADDLCWMPADVNKIFEAAGLPPQDLRVGDIQAMRKNCDRYLACLQAGGPWKSYAKLEAERDRLKAALATAAAALEPFRRAEEYIASDGAQHFYAPCTSLHFLTTALTRSDLQRAASALAEVAAALKGGGRV